MLIYGKNAVIEALQEGQVTRLMLAQGLHPGTVRELEKLAKAHDVMVENVPRIQLDQTLKTTHHQGVVAEMAELEFADEDAPFELAKKRGEKLLLVLLDQISDPRNYGAIIRSAEVLGAHGVITEERRSAPLSPVVAKTAAGATSYLPLVQVKNLPRYMEDLKKRNVWIYGSAGDGPNAPNDLDWDRDVALVIGSEGTGMRRLVRDTCDDMVKIPTKGHIEALNASVAAGVLLYAIQTARGLSKR
jgi:23S rRNA (guanosine2251-2'-O)-methyltransferase